MLITLLILLVIFGLLLIWSDSRNDFSSGVFIIGVVLIMVAGIISSVATDSEIITAKSATSVKLVDELVVKAEGYPTQIVKDMKFLDKKLEVAETQGFNIWGINCATSYTVRIVE